MAKGTKEKSRFPAAESQSEEDQNNGVNEEQDAQGELPEMPPSSPAGKAGRAYIRVHTRMKETIAKLKNEKGTAQDALIAEMDKIGKDSITVDGYTLVHKKIDEEKISVKAPKVND